jgi:CHASE2 domain-containing sensor protein
MTGDHRPAPRPDARSVSATFLLDPEQARDDAQLFGGRVGFIGATHLAAGDFWLTPGGVLPGVELLANTVRYAPLQRASPSLGVRVAHRALALLLFVFFVYVDWRLRGLAALFVATLGTLVVVATGLAAFEDLGVLDALEAAILLFVACKALETVLGFIADMKSKRAQFVPGPRGWWQTVKAACLRDHGAPHS